MKYDIVCSGREGEGQTENLKEMRYMAVLAGDII